MAYDTANIFAKILRGELPCHKVYEDESTLAFLDIMPQSIGHTLVIPKVAAENLFDIAPSALQDLIAKTQTVAKAVQKAVDAPGVMIAQLNGADAGQTVFHIHFHIIPRRDGADFGIHARDAADQDQLAALAERIRAAV
jgi:histidine triad (HIT) family protein